MRADGAVMSSLLYLGPRSGVGTFVSRSVSYVHTSTLRQRASTLSVTLTRPQHKFSSVLSPLHQRICPIRKLSTTPVHSVQPQRSDVKQLKQEVTEASARDRKRVLQGSQKVVALAMTTNGIMFLAKLYAAIQSGSASMFSEALHSLADVVNESLLFVGIHRSLREPDPQHPYGFTLERYAWALVSGVGIFFLGGGVSLYHGFAGLLAGPAHVIGDPTLSWAVLSCSLAFELGTMRYAYLHIKETATAAGQSVWDYIKRGADPTAVQIFLEDCAAVGGLALAGGFLTASKFLNLPWLDSLGSISIGLLLSGVAMFLIRRNIASLIGTRMRDTHEDSVVRLLERDPIISRVHDVKTTMLAPNVARFKAEILVDGQEVTRRYISQCEGWEKEVEVFQTLKTRKEIEEWTIRHGGGIVNTLGAEVDRLEMEIMRNRPEVKHIDLEI